MVSDPEKNALTGTGTPDPLLMQPPLLHADFFIVEGLKELPLPKLVVVNDDLKILDLLESKTAAPEPFCAIYEPKSHLPMILRHAAGNNSLRSFLEDFPIHYLSVKDPHSLQNVNEPAEQLQAEKILSAGKRKKT